MASIAQLPGSTTIELVQGNDFEILFAFSDENEDPLDLTDYAFAAGIDLACGDTVSVGVVAVNLSEGQVKLRLARVDTADIPVGTHHFWLDWVTPEDYRETMLAGDAIVTKR